VKLIELEAQIPYADHAFGTREEGDDKYTADDLVRTYTELLGPIAHMRQVHSDRIVYADDAGCFEEADAIFTDRDDFWLAVKTADCVPVLISSQHAVAAVHCGWRGLESGILPKTIQTLMDEFNMSGVDLNIHIGPCITQEHYKVDEKYKNIFDEKYFKPAGEKGYTLMNLPAVVMDQAVEAGVPRSHIVNSGLCTYEDADMFHSHRRNKEAGGDDYQVQMSLIRLGD